MDVHTFLLERAIPHEFVHIPHPFPQSADVCAVTGISPSDFVRVHVFDSDIGAIVVLAPPRLVPEADLVAEAAGTIGAQPARPERVSRLTGFPAEWAPPIAHQRPALVLADKTLAERDVVYAWAGEPGLILKLRAADLIAASGARPALVGHPLAAVR